MAYDLELTADDVEAFFCELERLLDPSLEKPRCVGRGAQGLVAGCKELVVGMAMDYGWINVTFPNGDGGTESRGARPTDA